MKKIFFNDNRTNTEDYVIIINNTKYINSYCFIEEKAEYNLYNSYKTDDLTKYKKEIVIQLTDSIINLHKRIIINDLKENNILVIISNEMFSKNKLKLKIIDFGCSAILNAKNILLQINSPLEINCGTSHYSNYNKYKHNYIDKETDIFAYAKIVYNIINEEFNYFNKINDIKTEEEYFNELEHNAYESKKYKIEFKDKKYDKLHDMFYAIFTKKDNYGYTLENIKDLLIDVL